jgi:hypothetical protein
VSETCIRFEVCIEFSEVRVGLKSTPRRYQIIDGQLHRYESSLCIHLFYDTNHSFYFGDVFLRFGEFTARCGQEQHRNNVLEESITTYILQQT